MGPAPRRRGERQGDARRALGCALLAQAGALTKAEVLALRGPLLRARVHLIQEQ